jgi:phosphoglycolate phosphatase/AHBA synthesis associated protein
MRAVLFDMDGVLVHSQEVWFQLMRAAAHHFGYPDIPRQDFLDTFGQGVEADVRCFFPGVHQGELGHYYSTHFRDHRDHFQVNPEAAPVLEALRRRGLASAVCTNTSTPLAREILGWTGLEPDLLVGSSDVARCKPAPDMVLAACQRLGVDTRDAVMVGDSAYDRDAARAAGVHFLGFGGFEGEAVLERLSEVLALL